MKNAYFQCLKTRMRQRNVHSRHSSASGVENASRRQRFAMEKSNVPMEKTRKVATSASRGDVRQTHSLVAPANAYRSTSSATQSFRVATAAMSRRTYADQASWSQTHSKDHRASLPHAATDTVRWNAATADVEARRLFVRDVMDVAMEATNSTVQFVVSQLRFFSSNRCLNCFSFQAVRFHQSAPKPARSSHHSNATVKTE